MSDTLSSSTNWLVQPAANYFQRAYQNPTIVYGAPIDRNLAWVPSFHFQVSRHLAIMVEVSDTPYPVIFGMRRHDFSRVDMPIAVYCVCPEDSYLARQADAKRVVNDGFGLITVDADGIVQHRASCIPIIHQITDEEFNREIKGLPKDIKVRLAEAFQKYKNSAPSGVADVSEVLEGLILGVGREAVKRQVIPASALSGHSPAKILDEMDKVARFNNARAAIGGAKAHISFYRNAAHHYPKDRKTSERKYRDCRYGFVDGIKNIVAFRDAIRAAQLKVTLP